MLGWDAVAAAAALAGLTLAALAQFSHVNERISVLETHITWVIKQVDEHIKENKRKDERNP